MSTNPASGQADLRVIDGHNDLPIALRFFADSSVANLDTGLPALNTDIPRLRAGQVGGQFWSVFVPTSLTGADAVQATLEQIDVVRRIAARYPDTFRLARSADEVEQARADGLIASLLGAEGGHSIGDSLAVLRILAGLGLRYLTLTHNEGPSWAQSCLEDPGTHGLTDFGREVVGELNRLGVLVDLSHTATATMHAALDVSRAPVIFSHSSCRAVNDHVRNVDDAVLARLADAGGLLMVTFVPAFISARYAEWEAADTARRTDLGLGSPLVALDASRANSPAWQQLRRWREANPAPEVSVTEVVAHLAHARDVLGVDHLGLGGDYDGVPAMPDALRDVSTYPVLLEALSGAGWSTADLDALTWSNAVRVLRDADDVAASLNQR